MYTACGEIRDVRFDKNELIVNVKEDFLFSILTKEENKNKIEELIKSIDDRIIIVFKKVVNKLEGSKQNLNKLKALFGEDLDLK